MIAMIYIFFFIFVFSFESVVLCYLRVILHAKH